MLTATSASIVVNNAEVSHDTKVTNQWEGSIALKHVATGGTLRLETHNGDVAVGSKSSAARLETNVSGGSRVDIKLVQRGALVKRSDSLGEKMHSV